MIYIYIYNEASFGHRQPRLVTHAAWIDYFLVTPGLSIKTRLRAQPLIWKWFFNYANKTHLHKKGCALHLILKVRVFGTRKWSISLLGSLVASQQLYGLFIMDLTLRSIQTWSADNFKKHVTSMSCTVKWHWSADTFFDRCQLTVTWLSIRTSTSELTPIVYALDT